MEHRKLLRGDCSRCQGLCCVSHAFDRNQWFSFDKLADEPCRHLRHSACTIHGQLAQKGMQGCANYDCYGAGQRVVQELYAGGAARSDEQRARAMSATFLRLRDVHELRLLLHESRPLPMRREQRLRLAQLLDWLEPTAGFTPTTLAALDIATLQRAVHAFLRSLAVHVRRDEQRRRLPLVR